MNRNDVTEMIIAAKIKKGIKWEGVAKKIGLSKEWVTAGCLGQMTFDKKQAATIGKIFGLDAEAVALLQVVPYKGSLPTAVPTDPLIYRFYELVSVYRHIIGCIVSITKVFSKKFLMKLNQLRKFEFTSKATRQLTKFRGRITSV